MSALSNAAANESPSTNNSITSISTNARIDYILRFSKHAVLVVGDNAEVYTQIAGQHVGNLSDKHNTSLLTISSRHNDIQIRCRIIEQLYGNVLFDPEQPLAVSILNFAKNNDENISVVVEQAQKLSLQLFHELCQLVEMGKKTGVVINVLMVGSLEAGTIIAQNKLLFKGKLSILSAKSGQLISHSHPIFKKQSVINYAKIGYILLALSLTVFLTVMGALALDKYNVINLEKVWESFDTSSSNTLVPKVNDIDEHFVLPRKTKARVAEDNGAETLLDIHVLDKKLSLLPENQEIFNALNTLAYFDQVDITARLNKPLNPKAIVATAPKHADNEVVEVSPMAKPITITDKEQTEKTLLQQSRVENTGSSSLTAQDKLLNEISVKSDISEAKPTKKMIETHILNMNASSDIFTSEPIYYQEIKSGFLIQLSGFTQLKAYQEFVAAYPELVHHTYLKQVNGQEMMIMTTPVYNNRTLADNALKALPIEIQNSGVWIKSLALVKNEIKDFNRSFK